VIFANRLRCKIKPNSFESQRFCGSICYLGATGFCISSSKKGIVISITDGLVLLDGLPLHPLIIHVTVVALPLAVVMVVLSLTWQRFRRYDLLTLAVLVIGSGSAFLASMSGRDLSAKIGVSLEHSTWGFYVPIASTVLANFSFTSLAIQNMAKITRGKTVSDVLPPNLQQLNL
jgi:hypothetical protein